MLSSFKRTRARRTSATGSMRSKLLTLPRTLRKMLPGKKSLKNPSDLDDFNEKKSNGNKSKSKDLHSISVQEQDLVANFFKSKKRLVDTDDESTLKGEYRQVTPSSTKLESKKQTHVASTALVRAAGDILFSTTFSIPETLNKKYQGAYENTESNTGSPSFNLTDCSAGTIDRHSNQDSVNTPGARINSETGDVIQEDKANVESNIKHRQQILLSSTAIDGH